MGTTLAHRGPDGIAYYCGKSVGFVHCMLHDTPESLIESLPNCSKDGKTIVTFHGRIDNRQELYNRIGWIKPLATVTDSDLVLDAYRKWKSNCIDYLLGDFAFALWDEKENTVFCARDHMGVKPFYYSFTGATFAFASEIKALFAIPEIVKTLNEERVAEYLASVVIENESTFYKNIFRLPPGHFLEIKANSMRRVRYHQFCPAIIHCKNDHEFEEQFREIFTNAVRDRLRSAYPIGAYLSGGLDSASIVCTAAGLFAKQIPGKLHTFSGIFDKIKQCDEQKYFSSILEQYKIPSHTLHTDSVNPSYAYEKLLKEEDEPFLLPHIFMSMGLLPQAREAGVRILLDGHDGDAAVSYGYSIFSELLLSGSWRELASLYNDAGMTSGKSIFKRILHLCWYVICNRIPVGVPFSPQREKILQSLRLLDNDFAAKTDIKARLISKSGNFPYFGEKEKVFHAKNITQPCQPFVLELFERVTVKEGFVARYPYFDKRVIEFCLALPARQKLRKGLNRSIVRRALGDLLPEIIRERKNKTDFTASLLNAFTENDQGWLLQNLEIVGKEYSNCVNNEFLKTSIARFVDINNPCRAAGLRELLLAVQCFRWEKNNFMNVK